jgi:hypothetical protein
MAPDTGVDLLLEAHQPDPDIIELLGQQNEIMQRPSQPVRWQLILRRPDMTFQVFSIA